MSGKGHHTDDGLDRCCKAGKVDQRLRIRNQISRRVWTETSSLEAVPNRAGLHVDGKTAMAKETRTHGGCCML
jgi:hypothetical protein